MGTLSAANGQALCDSLAKALIDLNSTFVTYPASLGIVSQIQGGLLSGSPSFTSRVLALGDAGLELTLLPASQTVGTTVSNGLAATTVLSAYSVQFFAGLSALDSATNGLSTFLVTNAIQVHAYFGAAFNSFAAQAIPLGYRGLGAPVAAIPATSIFIPTNQTLGTLTYTSNSVNSFSAGAAINGTQYAPAPLSIVIPPPGRAGARPGGDTSRATRPTLDLPLEPGDSWPVHLGSEWHGTD